MRDPEIDFVNTPESVFADLGILKKNELLRLDLTSMTLANWQYFSTFKSAGSKSGPVWTAYPERWIRVSANRWRAVPGRLLACGKVPEFNPSGGLLVLYPGKGAGSLVRYRFAGGKAQMDELQTLDYSNPPDQQVFEVIFKRKLAGPMADEYTQNPVHKEISVKDIMARSIEPSKSEQTEGQTQSTSPLVTGHPITNTLKADRSQPTTERAAEISTRKEKVGVWPWFAGAIIFVVVFWFVSLSDVCKILRSRRMLSKQRRSIDG